MENFFNWITNPMPKDEIVIWFKANNMIYEKIELHGDIFKSLYYIIIDTYLGDSENETNIHLSIEEKKSHFEWCWKKMIDNFKKENININLEGDHKEYLESFFMDSFYNQKDNHVKNSIEKFITLIFDVDGEFTKADLEMLTDFYKILEKSMI